MLTQIYTWWQNFVEWAYGIYIGFLDWIIGLVTWAFDYLLYIVWKAFDTISITISQFIAAIPKPSFLTNSETFICSAIENLSFGIDFIGPIALIVSALVLRFILRRMPFIN